MHKNSSHSTWDSSSPPEFRSSTKYSSISSFHSSSSGLGKYGKLLMSSILMSSITCFLVISMMFLKFFPVVEFVFFSHSLKSICKCGFFDFLICSIISKNLFNKTLLRCGLPEMGSIKPLWVGWGRSSMIFMLLFQLLSSFTAPGQNRSHRTLPYQLEL